jgi:hypothetical protein
MQNVEAFYNELTPILEKIKESPEAFLDGTEVSKVTLWRWTNGINRKYPDPHKLLSLLSKISHKDNVIEVADHFGENISSFLKHSFPTFFQMGKKGPKIEELQNSIFQDFNTFMIFILCETESGASKEELIHTIGSLAFKKIGLTPEEISADLITPYGSLVEGKINDLVKMGVLDLDKDQRYHARVKDIIFNVDTITRFFPEIISGFTRKSNVDMDLSGIFGYQQTIPLELAKEIKKETKEFFLKCYSKMKENKCKGGIPYQIINFSDKLFFEKNELGCIGAQL